MKKVFYALILLLFVVSGLVLANRQIKNEPSKKSALTKEKAGTAKVVFKSADGGQTWQDISKGLPENLDKDGIPGNRVFANDKGLFLKVGSEFYRSNADATAPFWTKEVSPGENRSVSPGKSGIFAYNYWGVNVKKTNGTSVWSPVFHNTHEPRLRSTFETAAGTVFIGTDEGILKTDNSGKTWKLVYAGNFVGHLAEANGVLLAIGRKKIIRSTDNGENWTPVMSEDSVAFDVKAIKGGFAAITSNSDQNTPKTSRLSVSYDGGKTWQPIDFRNKVLIDSVGRTWDERPLLKAFQTSITQVGENFFCSHPYGIFKSSDKGKTWKLLLSSIDGKVFNVFGSGNTLYAIPSKGGC